MRFVAEHLAERLETGAVAFEMCEPYCAVDFPVWWCFLRLESRLPFPLLLPVFDPTCLSSPSSFHMKPALISPQSQRHLPLLHIFCACFLCFIVGSAPCSK